MKNIRIEIADIVDMDTDCIVNAANNGLRMGSGVCGAIFDAAGPEKLTEACRKLVGCPTGSAVITSGFDLKAKYIIHAVGPKWTGSKEDKEHLAGCYEKSLDIAKENDCHSITFPLISAGIFGCPVDQAWEQAIEGCTEWLDSNPDYDIDVIFAVRKQEVKSIGESVLSKASFNESKRTMSKEELKKHVKEVYYKSVVYLEGIDELDIKRNDEKITVQISSMMNHFEDEYCISQEEWDHFIDKLYDDICINKWKHYYKPNEFVICDGQNWKLQITVEGGKRKRIYRGESEYPDNWDEFISLLEQFVEKKDI